MLMFERIIALIAPHTCLTCGREGTLLCSDCSQKLPMSSVERAPALITAVYAATLYAGDARRLVRALKFDRAGAAAGPIARTIACRLPRGYRPDVVTYVPTATSRLRARGYDHTRLIARAVAAELGVPCLPLLGRRGQQRQVGQRKEVRQQQLTNAFYARRHQLPGHVLLVDDVITTGSTLQAAAVTLQAAGAGRVDAAVFAKA